MSTAEHPQAAVSIVVIDDNPASLDLIENALAGTGVTVHTADDPDEGLSLVRSTHPQIVLTDLVMPNQSGIDVLEQVMAFDPTIDVVLMTAHYTTETAVEAIRKGAADYLNKPISVAVLRERVSRIAQEARRRVETLRMGDESAAANHFHGIIGRSPKMWDVFARVQRVAPHFRNLLISGATGTGKDLVAQAVHALSPARSGRFVVVNCSAVVESLFESELFGHIRGSFTGAVADKAGLFEHANGGTLFLDEIGDMPLTTQAKLLRVVQHQEVQRVGSLTARKVDVRVVAATHVDLRAAVREGKFREDLFYRLSMLEIKLPPLRERREDLPLLEHHFVQKFASQFGKDVKGLTPRARAVLAAHSWPGNIRELENVIGHSCVMALGELIDVEDLPPYLWSDESPEPLSEAAETPPPSGTETLAEQERRLLEKAMREAGGNQSQAARALRIGRDALRYKLKKFDIT